MHVYVHVNEILNYVFCHCPSPETLVNQPLYAQNHNFLFIYFFQFQRFAFLHTMYVHNMYINSSSY
jgi:hypothetical protein